MLLLVELVPFLFRIRLAPIRSAALSVSVNDVADEMSTLLVLLSV